MISINSSIFKRVKLKGYTQKIDESGDLILEKAI